MDDLENRLESHAPILRAAEAPAQAPPESAIRAMNEALARTFNRSVILTEARMRLLILELISQTPMDGFGLVEKLVEEGVALKTRGEGVIYGLLAQLEAAGALEGRWRETGAAMTKTYHLTGKGSEQMETGRAASSELSALVNRAGAFGR